MIFRDPRYRRRLTPSVNLLESRRLLSFVVASDGQHGSDFVGPDTSQGSDGIMDVHLALTGLSHTDVNYITVQGPPGFEWQTAPSGTTYNSVGMHSQNSSKTHWTSSKAISTSTLKSRATYRRPVDRSPWGIDRGSDWLDEQRDAGCHGELPEHQ